MACLFGDCMIEDLKALVKSLEQEADSLLKSSVLEDNMAATGFLESAMQLEELIARYE